MCVLLFLTLFVKRKLSFGGFSSEERFVYVLIFFCILSERTLLQAVPWVLDSRSAQIHTFHVQRFC